MWNRLKDWLEPSFEVEQAIEKNLPVVAIESTVITWGLPYPDNLMATIKMENEVRKQGAVPATIAIIGGKIKIGITDEELEFLAKNQDQIIKANARDIPYLIAMKANGALTVSATMVIADLLNIKFVVTGGIGGVHRGAESTFDISSDLTHLSRLSTVVISSGTKSIMDIPKTLEFLETMGVLVVGWKTNKFPAFYTRDSGYKIEHVIDSEDELVQMIKFKSAAKLNGSILVVNPIPREIILREEIEKVIQEAIKEAEEKNITGKALTPFLLSKINEKTGGRAVDANLLLLENNAKLAGMLASAYM